jgi:hypothetical protein
MRKVYSDENGDDFTVRRRAPSVQGCWSSGRRVPLASSMRKAVSVSCSLHYAIDGGTNLPMSPNAMSAAG